MHLSSQQYRVCFRAGSVWRNFEKFCRMLVVCWTLTWKHIANPISLSVLQQIRVIIASSWFLSSIVKKYCVPSCITSCRRRHVNWIRMCEQGGGERGCVCSMRSSQKCLFIHVCYACMHVCEHRVVPNTHLSRIGFPIRVGLVGDPGNSYSHNSAFIYASSARHRCCAECACTCISCS